MTTTTLVPVLALPQHITAALVELHADRAKLGIPAADDTAALAALHVRRMFLAARLSAWWAVLARWLDTDSDLPGLLALAASRASLWELDEAESARDDLARQCLRSPGAA